MFSIEDLKEDLNNVGVWLNTDPKNIKFQVEKVSISLFSKQIDEMEKTYKTFPKEKQRTNKIEKLIKKGGKCLPVFVEKNDDSHFIMEGRHRIIAFRKLGIKDVYVAYCST